MNVPSRFFKRSSSDIDLMNESVSIAWALIEFVEISRIEQNNNFPIFL
jgi:hypothetical protein